MLPVLVQSWCLQHPSTTQTYFFRALERREALSLFYRRGVEEQSDCRIYLRSPKKAMTKRGTSQIAARCFSSQDRISFSAIAFPSLPHEHEWHRVKTYLVVVWGRNMRHGLFECIRNWNEFRKPILSGFFTVWISSSRYRLTLPSLLELGQKSHIPWMCKNFWHEFLYMHIYILASVHAVRALTALNSAFHE